MTDTTVPPGFENLTEYLDAELYDAEYKVTVNEKAFS